jgi:hypothetical protein
LTGSRATIGCWQQFTVQQLAVSGRRLDWQSGNNWTLATINNSSATGGTPLVPTIAEQEEAMKLGSAELKALMARHKVNLVIQALYYHSDFTTMAAFSNFAEDDEDLRLSLEGDFDINAKSEHGFG